MSVLQQVLSVDHPLQCNSAARSLHFQVNNPELKDSRNTTEPIAVAPGQSHDKTPTKEFPRTKGFIVRLTRRYRDRFCGLRLSKFLDSLGSVVYHYPATVITHVSNDALK
jgi:hypothetical protein